MAHDLILTDPDKFYREFVSTEEAPLPNPKKMTTFTGLEKRAMERYAEDSLYKPGEHLDMAALKNGLDAEYANASDILLEVVGKMVLYKKNPLKDQIVKVEIGIGNAGEIVHDLFPNAVAVNLLDKIYELAAKVPAEDRPKMDARVSNIIDVHVLNLALYIHARKAITPQVTISCEVASRLGILGRYLTGIYTIHDEIVGKNYLDAVTFWNSVMGMYNPSQNEKFQRVILGRY
jgi:hypothetical protein